VSNLPIFNSALKPSHLNEIHRAKKTKGADDIVFRSRDLGDGGRNDFHKAFEFHARGCIGDELLHWRISGVQALDAGAKA
jgi:hypothetical protein